MQHYLFQAPLPPPLPPPQSGRGTILSQEARLHALQIAEEIQAERGSYRKWNEVAKAVNRQYGSNVDGDLVKRQVTSMLRSVQRSGLNSVKRPRKHAEVIQQLLDPVAKRQCGSPTTPLRIRAAGEEGEGEVLEGGEARGVINVELEDSSSNTGSEGGTPPATPAVSDAAQPAQTEKTDSTSPTTATTTTTTTTATTTTTSSDVPVPLPTGEAAASPTKPASSPSSTTPAPENGTNTAVATVAKLESKKGASENGGDSHSIERVPRKRSEKYHTQVHHQLTPVTPIIMQPPIAHFAPPLRILPTMTVEEVYNLVLRVHPDIDAEFIRTQEIDGNAFQTLTHKELTDFGVNTFGKRNKLLQLCISYDAQAIPPPGNPQDFFYGRIPAFSSSPAFIEAKSESEKHDKESNAEKKPPVTKVLDMEVVGVRKRYLIERENGIVEVLTPCKLRKYKHLTAAFEHIHPDKLVPIPTFSQQFTHVPSSNHNNSSSEDSTKNTTTPSDSTSSSSSSSTPTTPAQKTSKSKTKNSPKQANATQATFISPPAAYYPVYYPSGPFPSSHPSSGNLQWVPSAFPGVSAQRTPEKYHSFHPYTPPQPPK